MTLKKKDIKKAYAIPCPSAFRDQIEVLCRRRKVNAADLARSVILTLPEDIINASADPGEPDANDREPASPASKASRKPRLQVRLPEGYSIPFVRRALNLALTLNSGKSARISGKKEEAEEENRRMKEENEKLKTIISSLMFDSFKGSISTREEAYYILGLRPFSQPTPAQIKQRFRMLATIHHPDSELGSHERMSRLNEAMEFLTKSLR